MLSSKEEPVIKAEAFARGANDYLVKLPDKIELIARIRYHSKAYLNQLQRDEAYRALRESPAPAPALAMASAEVPAAPAPSVTANSGESSTWDQTSLIGKIFIGFGALLTMASAARMFMA